MKITTTDALNFGSVICVSISMATVIQVLQIIMLILSIALTGAGIIAKLYEKIKNKSLTLSDLKDAKEDIDELVEKVDKLKGDKNE